jgi:acyl-CoA synthetase (NDP forming)
MQIPSLSLSSLLRPGSIALVGASPRIGSFGHGLRGAIRSLGYTGNLYLVNPKYEEIDGVACYPTLASLPKRVDCAAFAIADHALEAAMEAAAGAGIRSAVLFGQAYGRSRDGRPLTERIALIAREAGMSLCGANCMGYVNYMDRLQMTGLPFRNLPEAGAIALISHSGSTWSGVVGNLRGLKFNFAISAGQELVTTLADYIGFLVSQPSTRVICCVVEMIRNPEAFLAAMSKARERNIAVIALKLGRSEVSQQFAESHSGALSGKAEVYDAVFERAGVISVRSLDEMLDTAELFAGKRIPPTPYVGLGTDSGGERQLICDLAEDIGLRFAPLEAGTADALTPFLGPGLEPSNPLDFWGDRGTDIIAPCLQTLANDRNVGTVVLASNMADGRQYLHHCADALEATYRMTTKPVVALGNIATTMSPSGTARLRSLGIPVLMGTETALRALRHFSDFHSRRHPTEPPFAATADDERAAKWRKRLAHSRTADARDSYELLQDFGIPVAPWLATQSLEDAVVFAEEAGYPVVAKIDLPEVAHKSDVGGVMLGLSSRAELENAVRTLQAAHGPALLLQKQLRGVELIIGMAKDSQFGPVFTIGIGGIFVEVLRDFAVLLPGDGKALIQKKLLSLRAAALLTGARGAPVADLAAVADVIGRFIDMGCCLSDTATEMEINPLIVSGSSIAAVDALVIVQR